MVFFSMDKLTKGAVQATKNMSLKKGERVLIVAEKETKKVSFALKKACSLKTAKVDFFVLEDFGKRPLKKLPEKIVSFAKKADVVFFTAGPARKAKVNERFTVRMPLTKIAMKNGARLAAMIGIDKKCMEQGMNADYQKVSALTKKVFSKVSGARRIVVSSPSGTALVADFSKKISWIKCDGLIKSGSWSNLPDGEVFTCPETVNGVAVIDGSMGDSFSKKYGSLKNNPVTWVVENSRIVAVSCPKNKALEKEFRKYLKHDSNSNRIGEFAIGTNFRVKEIIGNLLQDEKIIGVHLAVGNPYPEETGANWNSKVHCDGVILKPTVFVDGNKIMEKGVFTI
jgi:aminopeptidase